MTIINEASAIQTRGRRRSLSAFDIRGGQNTNKTADKIGSEEWRRLNNLRIREGDLVVRNGIENLASTSGLSGVGVYKNRGNSAILGTRKTGESAEQAAPGKPDSEIFIDPSKIVPLVGSFIFTPKYKITYVTPNGETLASPESDEGKLSTGGVTNGFNTRLTLPIGGSDVIARRVYTNSIAGGVYRLLDTVDNNTSTTWEDPRDYNYLNTGNGNVSNLPDSTVDALFPQEPVENTTAGELSSLVNVNTTNGLETVLNTNIAGSALDSAVLHGYFYTATGAQAFHYYNSSNASGNVESGTISVPSGRAIAMESIDRRLVVVERTIGGDIVRFSKLTDGTSLIDSNLVPSGTELDRAGRLSTVMNHVDVIKADGNVIFLFGNGDAEVHVIPDPNESGRTTFPLEYNTLVRRYENVGKISAEGAVVAENRCYFMTDGKSINWISPDARDVQHIYENSGQMRSLLWDEAALGYSQKEQEVYITGKEYGSNNTTVVLDLETGQIVFDTGYYAKKWITTEEDVFFLDYLDDSLKRAFSEDLVDDGDVQIHWEANTKMRFDEDDHYEKRAEMVDLEFATTQVVKVYCEFYADRDLLDQDSIPNWRYEFDLAPKADLTTDNGLGFERNPSDPFLGAITEQDKRIAINYRRAEMKLSGNSLSGFRIKRVGWSFRPTSKLYKRS